MNNPYFTTTNRKLENFLYLHKIYHVGQHKSEDGMTTWVYLSTPRFKEVLDEFRSIHQPSIGSEAIT